MEHQGLAGVRAAVGHPEAQGRQVMAGPDGLWGFGAGARGRHSRDGSDWPGEHQMEPAPT
ncbi:MAG: hypothetical protein EB070_08930 [Synechococcaceae bacterium WBA_2_066]|nr:hypothetical protein [Synechococcaceae bacterium WBA_2_066]